MVSIYEEKKFQKSLDTATLSGDSGSKTLAGNKEENPGTMTTYKMV